MPKEKHVTSIRLQDLELLRNLAAIEGRDMTEILHRALIGYAVSAGTGVKVPASDVVPLFPKTKQSTTAASNESAKLPRGTPDTQPRHETSRSRPRPIAQTRH